MSSLGREGERPACLHRQVPQPPESQSNYRSSAQCLQEPPVSSTQVLSCLRGIAMPTPEQARILANGPGESHDVREPRVTRQYTKIFKATAGPGGRNLLAAANYV